MKLIEINQKEIEKEYEIIKTNSEYLVQISQESFYNYDKYFCFVMEYCQVIYLNN